MTFVAMNRVLSSFTSGPGVSVWENANNFGRERQVGSGRAYATILNNVISALEGKCSPSMSHKSSELISTASSWQISSTTLHEWCTRSYDLSLARGLNTLLANYALFPSSDCGGGTTPAVEASLIFLTRSSHLFLQREEYDRAKVMARRACWLARKHSLLFHLGWQLLQIALIDLEASSPTGAESSLPPLLECLHLSEQYSMDPLRAVALATLAKVFLHMGKYQKARALLLSAMPLVMQHGHIWFQGEAFLTSAKCYLAEAVVSTGSDQDKSGLSTFGKKKRDQLLQMLNLQETALAELKKAASHFCEIEDVCRLRQVYYLQARVCHALSTSAKKKQRDEAAKAFAMLSSHKKERSVEPVVMGKRNQGGDHTLWGVLDGVMITSLRDLMCCVSLKKG